MRHYPRHNVITAAALFVLIGLTGCSSAGGGTATPTAFTSAGAPLAAETPAPGNHDGELPWDGKTRSYRVHAPPGYDRSRPLAVVIALHFFPGTGSELAKTTGLDAKADSAGFLAVYPNGRGAAFNALVCCGNEDDVGFIGALVERLKNVWGVDPNRIFVTGISNGGDMSFRLAVELPGVFAAIAPVSGGFSGQKATNASYRPKSPIPVITFIGGQDSHAGLFEAGITSWQERLSCPPAPAVKVGKVGTVTTAICPGGSPVVVYRLPQMGHSWPGSPQGTLADPQAGVVATDLIWEFFAAVGR